MEVWARNAGSEDRAEPETKNVERGTGWPVVYEQLGGKPPERAVFNQLLYELWSMFVLMRNRGLPLEWDVRLNYTHRSWCLGSDGVEYITRRNTGPNWANAADPTTQAGRASWRKY